MHASTSSRAGRNLQLDVLRGVAILLVFGRHLKVVQPEGVMGGVAEVWYHIGWIGVDLFFVLSGFLIGGLLLSEWDRHGRIQIGRFLVRRGLKIYPLFYLFMAYLFLMPMARAMLGGGDVWGSFYTRWLDLWPNLVFLNNYFHDAVGHTWSLAVEEHFYLTLPFLLGLLGRWGGMRWLGWICLAMTVVCLGLRCLAVAMGDPLGVRMAATHLRIDALFLGVGIRALAQFAPDRFAALRGWRVGLIVLGILLWTPNFVIAPDTPWIRTVGLTGTLLGAGALLVGVFHTRASDFGRLATGVAAVSGVLAWVGTDSYAIYLWHVTLFGILEQRVVPHLGALAAPATLLGWALSAGVVCLVAILFGAAASRVVEWPVLRLRDRYFPSRSGTLPPTRQQAVRPRSPIPTEAGSYPQPLAEVGPEPANPGT